MSFISYDYENHSVKDSEFEISLYDNERYKLIFSIPEAIVELYKDKNLNIQNNLFAFLLYHYNYYGYPDFGSMCESILYGNCIPYIKEMQNKYEQHKAFL